MKLITKFLCALGFHRWDDGYWYERRLVFSTTKEEWVFIKTCVHCKHRVIG